MQMDCVTGAANGLGDRGCKWIGWPGRQDKPLVVQDRTGKTDSRSGSAASAKEWARVLVAPRESGERARKLPSR